MKLRFFLLVENAYERMSAELEMAKTTFDEELAKRDAIIDGLLADNTRINSDFSLLDSETTVKCKIYITSCLSAIHNRNHFEMNFQSMTSKTGNLELMPISISLEPKELIIELL